METIATICTSGGILEQGAIAAGLTPIWGVEIDPIVAELYRLNYPNSKTVVSDACKVDWRLLPTPDVLHASPSCRHFSIANNKSEAQQDIDLAKAITRALAHFQPKVFTLENVPAYSQSESWIAIAHQLEQLGYSINAQVYNLALFGIPQQRKRFIAIATKESTPPILIVPNRTAYWYECIEDLLGELKPSKLTNTQTNKLHPKIERVIATGETALLKRNQIRKYTPAAISNNPYCWTVTAKLCTDQHGRDRRLFADLVTPTGTYSLNTHCLARIQTIPDSYKLSGEIATDGLVIGDAVPPLFAQQMFEQILQHFKKSTMVDQLHKVTPRIYSSPLQESTMVDKPQ
ncbi:MAG: DNA cytosine methyltransferase [Pleurocapsa sp. MO_226.B13]|nr:DNA cytosine methyltransferase [Pleurocapsa sp. MO_226.B13]